ncbi:probable sodium/metabolite cotransporter BASS6, chloroplastic isoform X2 [Manihot esculenta]|nr:probable sodium/metabolite cotransporter BASS6, chloroplastic isoform X2 [Manihot esculenta]
MKKMTVNGQQWQIQRPFIPQFHAQNIPHVRKCSLFPLFTRNCSLKSSELCVGFSVQSNPHSKFGSPRILVGRCVSEKFSDHFEQDAGQNFITEQKMVEEKNFSVLNILKQSNSLLPHAVLASTLLALVYPPSFTWFTSRYYAPALGFLMFAVGVNSSEKDFIEAFKRPAAILAGYVGQFAVKPILGYLVGIISVSVFGLPTPIGAGIMLVSCVSGAQLSSYATFLTDPPLAPLSIVMTSLSTATAVFVTPLLSLLLIGKRLPVDVKGMVASIMQIVVTPIAAGLLLNRFFPWIANAIRPFLPPLSVLVTACCVGAPLAINVKSVVSPFGATILSLIISFHLLAFVIGYVLTGLIFPKAPDLKALQRTMSFETGMQSSLLALALANRFFQDPLVAVPPAISTVIMSLMGFFLVMVWAKKKEV